MCTMKKVKVKKTFIYFFSVWVFVNIFILVFMRFLITFYRKLAGDCSHKRFRPKNTILMNVKKKNEEMIWENKQVGKGESCYCCWWFHLIFFSLFSYILRVWPKQSTRTLRIIVVGWVFLPKKRVFRLILDRNVLVKWYSVSIKSHIHGRDTTYETLQNNCYNMITYFTLCTYDLDDIIKTKTKYINFCCYGIWQLFGYIKRSADFRVGGR